MQRLARVQALPHQRVAAYERKIELAYTALQSALRHTSCVWAVAPVPARFSMVPEIKDAKYQACRICPGHRPAPHGE